MYPVSEDSVFFAEFLKKYFSKLKDKNISYLDMGCGSGILAETAKKSGVKDIFAADIDSDSIDFVKKKGFKTIRTDLFSKIPKTMKFDLITFNAPYLPKNKFDKEKDTTGGKKGDEISLKFLKQAKQYLKKYGRIFLLISSITPQLRIKKLKPKIIAKKRLFFEELFILEFTG